MSMYDTYSVIRGLYLKLQILRVGKIFHRMDLKYGKQEYCQEL